MGGSLRVGAAVVGGVVAVAVACGGSTSSVPDGQGGTSSSSSTTSGASGSSSSSGTSGGTGSTSSSSSGGPVAMCPADVPSGACPRAGLECEYGNDPRLQCRTHAECVDGAWAVQAAKCVALPPVTCPASRDAADGKACTPTGAFCDYAGDVCECTNCTHYPVEQCNGPVTWRCEAPSTTPGCPAGRPRLGTACSTEGELCLYGCEHDASRQCTAGTWASASSPGGCPRSTRKVKTDIHYLSDAERAAMADNARSLRLSTWRYTGRLDDGRPHVGYILEDAPTSPASNMSREEVDLYTYTSLTLALAQQQQREIEDLKRELRELKAARR